MNTITIPAMEEPLTPAEKFEKFHAENPWVYVNLSRLTIDLVNKGHTKIGMGMLFEVLRWDYLMKTQGEPFKLNNNFRAYYSRLIEKRLPRFAGVFTKRESKADDN